MNFTRQAIISFWILIMSFLYFLLHFVNGLLKHDQVLQKGLLLQLLLFTLFGIALSVI